MNEKKTKSEIFIDEIVATALDIMEANKRAAEEQGIYETTKVRSFPSSLEYYGDIDHTFHKNGVF